MAELLFEYAELQTDSKGRPAAVSGELRLRPNGDGAAKFGPAYKTLVHGQLTSFSVEQIKKLDKMEAGGPKDNYVRVRVVTSDGTQAWAYEFQGAEDAWRGFRLVRSGDWGSAPGHR
jgi:hypothetical protein